MAAAALEYYQSVRDREEYKGLPHFLFGESMGGMIVYLMHNMDPQGWDGIVMAAPLFVQPGPMRPTPLQLMGFGLVKPFVSSWAIFPPNNIIGKAIRDPARQKMIAGNPRRYAGAHLSSISHSHLISLPLLLLLLPLLSYVEARNYLVRDDA